MSFAPRILAFAGSARKESYNKKLARLAGEAARRAGAEVSFLDLRDYPLPLVDEDLEAAQGLPAHVLTLKKLFIEQHGFIIASPEYNSSFSPLLKNTIDWISRPNAGEAPLAGFVGKVAGLVSASPGNLGGLRGLVHVRSVLGNIGVLVIPDQVSVSTAHAAFTPEGTLTDAKLQARLEEAMNKLVLTAKRLHDE